jgi:hypothetical protein
MQDIQYQKYSLRIDAHFVHKTSGNKSSLFTGVGLFGEINNPMVLHAAAEDREVSLEARNDEEVVFNHFILVFIPDGNGIDIITAAVADVTNEVLSSGFSISDIITSVEALALGVHGISELSSLVITLKVMNIETGTSEAESEFAASILFGVKENFLFRLTIVNAPLVGAADRGVNDSVKGGVTNLVTRLNVSERVLSSAEKESGWENAMRHSFTSGVVIDEGDSL